MVARSGYTYRVTYSNEVGSVNFFFLSESGKFSGPLPLSYYNAVAAELEEKYDPSDLDRARMVVGGGGGGGTVNNNIFCFPIVVRSHLPPGVKVCLASVVVWSSVTISD